MTNNRSIAGPIATILSAGCVCALLDGVAAVVLYRLPVAKIFQSVASGLLGPAAFRGGLATAMIGLLLHCAIALAVAAAFYGMSRVASILLSRPVLSGAIYGAAVFFLMYLIVLPLSNLPGYSFRRIPPPQMLAEFVIHVFLVGIPVSLIVVRLSQTQTVS